jgi:hypothetical protein
MAVVNLLTVVRKVLRPAQASTRAGKSEVGKRPSGTHPGLG